MLTLRNLLLLVFLLVIHTLLPLANAAVLILPKTVDARTLGSNSLGVFDNFPSDGLRFQTVYTSDLFPNSGPIYITQIAYRPKSGSAFNFSLPNHEMTLSTTSKTDDGLDNIFANNVGTDATMVASGPLAFQSRGVVNGISNFDIVFNLAKPFLYDPANGNLLVDIKYFGPGTGNVGQIDAVDLFNDGVSRVRTNINITNRYSDCGMNVNSPTGCWLNGSGIDTSRAPVTQISYQLPTAITVPAQGVSSESARMGAFVELPNRPRGQRFQTLYASSLFGGNSASPVWIRELAFRPAPGQLPFILDIPDLVMSMSTTPLPDDNLSKTFRENVGTNATVVLSGPIQLSSSGAPVAGGPGEFDLTFKLSKPFLYDPSQGSLLVDMQFSGQATGVGGYIDAMDGFEDGVSRVRTNGLSGCGANDNNSPVGCSTDADVSRNQVNKSRAQVTRFRYIQELSLVEGSLTEETTDIGLVTIQPVNPVDSSVPVTLIGNATLAGTTSITSISDPHPIPTSMVGCIPAVDLEVSPDVNFVGDTTICISPQQLGADCSGQPKLLHWDGTKWVELETVYDAVLGQICGKTSSFSPFTIASISQTITFNEISNISLEIGSEGPRTVEITATASSNLPVTFSTYTPDVCTVNGSTVTILHPGTCSITTNQEGDANNTAAAEVVRSFAVNGVSQTIDFPSITNRALGASPFSPTVTASSGLTVTLTSNTPSVCTVTDGEVTLLATGGCTVVADQSGNETYAVARVTQTFTVIPVLLTQSIVFETIPNAEVQTSFSLIASASSGQDVAFSSLTSSVCTIESGVVTLVAKGTCTVAADQTGNETYDAAARVSQTFTVTAVSQTIDFPSITNRALGASPFSPTVTASSGLTVTLTSNTPSVCSLSGMNVNLLTLGTCILQANQAGNDIYAATSTSQSFSVSAASVSGDNDSGDVPLPPWAYLLLALVLMGYNVVVTKRSINSN